MDRLRSVLALSPCNASVFAPYVPFPSFPSHPMLHPSDTALAAIFHALVADRLAAGLS